MRIRRFERKAWGYKQAYRKLSQGAQLNPATHAKIERLAATQKKHRSCDRTAAELKFINSA